MSGVEEVVEAREGLEGEEGDVGAAGDEDFELGAEGSIATEEEVNAGVCVGAAGGEGGRERGKKLQALLGAHVAGVEEDDFLTGASGG